MTESLGIITARGGSKGIPGKNLRPLCGRPLIFYTIAAAKCSKLMSRFVVSTDDQEIAGVSRSFGAEVIDRPAHLAQDSTPTLPVLQHVLSCLRDSESYRPDLVVTLQPTSPLREGDFIDRALTFFQLNEGDSAIGVSQLSAKVGKLSGNYYLPSYKEGQPRQEMESLHKENGSIYITRYSVIMDSNSIFGSKTLAFVTDHINGLDIDTEPDLQLAECLLEQSSNRFRELVI